MKETVTTADMQTGATEISMAVYTAVVLMAAITNRATEMDVSISKTEM